ncbi:MAG TPA: ribose-phosphate pyrophosphokinase [Myxococcota bacterium]|nr:ribose-phosphate pyrophosphokinase [Myxococcota bacterium]
MSDNPIKVFSGNSNPSLAKRIAEYLEMPLGNAVIKRFADGEVNISIAESVRGYHAYVVQSLSPPANEHLMELLVMIDALKRASAVEITVVMPYYGYARQDRKAAPREPITAKLVADLLEAAGATRLISLDLHAGQIQGFFNVPVDHLYASPIFIEDIKQKYSKEANKEELVVVSPDAGGVERARAYAKRLDATLAIIDKRRPAPGVAEVMNIIGDVKDKRAIIIDDMIDTAGTLVNAAEAVMKAGAKSICSYATHGIFSPPAIERIKGSVIEEVVVTDTVPLREDAKSCEKIRVLSCASLVGEAISRVHTGASVSSLFV